MSERMHKPNCLGFTLHRLGLIREEVYIEPGDYRELQAWFEPVRRLDEADVVAFTKWTGKRWLLHHLALVDPGDKNYLIHRSWPGAAVTREHLMDVRSTYHLDKGYFMICLKRSFTADC